MLERTACALVVSALSGGCEGIYKPDPESVTSISASQAGRSKIEVVVNEHGYIGTGMTSLIQDGVQRSRVTCAMLDDEFGNTDCKIVWTVNRSSPVRPFVSVPANLYLSGNLSQAMTNIVPNPNTQQRAAFVRVVSDMMETLRARRRRQ